MIHYLLGVLFLLVLGAIAGGIACFIGLLKGMIDG